MTFSETNVNRESDGKFAEKTGSAPDAAVAASLTPKPTYIYRIEGDDHETEDVEASSEDEALDAAAEIFAGQYFDEDEDDYANPEDIRDLLTVKAIYKGDIDDYDDEWVKVTPGKMFPDPDYVHKPGQYAGYEVKNYKELPIGMEGGAFTASIWRDGKRVMLVENSGDGGANVYTDISDPKKPTRHRGPAVEEFVAASSAIYGPDTLESDDALFGLALMGGQLDKAVTKNNWPRDEVVEANLEGNYLSDVEKSILRDPSLISRIRG